MWYVEWIPQSLEELASFGLQKHIITGPAYFTQPWLLTLISPFCSCCCLPAEGSASPARRTRACWPPPLQHNNIQPSWASINKQTNRSWSDRIRPCAYFLSNSQTFSNFKSSNRIYSEIQSDWIKHCLHIYIYIEYCFCFFIQKEKVFCGFIHMCMYRYRKVTTPNLLWCNHGQQDRRRYLHQTGNITIIFFKKERERERKITWDVVVTAVVTAVFQKYNPTVPSFKEEGAGFRSHD